MISLPNHTPKRIRGKTPGSRAIRKNKKTRGRDDILTGPLRFCVSWYKLFLLLGALYFGLVLYVYIQISSNDEYESGGQNPSPIRVAKSINKAIHSQIVDGIQKVKLVRGIHNNNNNIGNAIGNSNNVLRGQQQPKALSSTSNNGGNGIIKHLTIDENNNDDHDIMLDHLDKIKRTENELNAKSCRRQRRRGQKQQRKDDNEDSNYYYYSADGSCSTTGNGKNNKIHYYNFHESKARYVCGKRIEPKSSIVMSMPCVEPARLLQVIPDTNPGKNSKLPPIVTRFNDRANHKKPHDFDGGCDVPCQVAGMASIYCTRTVDSTPWEIQFSMEGPKYYTKLNINSDAYKNNIFYSTTSYRSEIPLPYFSWAEYQIQTPPVQYDTAIKGAVFMARNCKSKNDREDMVKFLRDSPKLRVDSVSSCLHNAEIPPGTNRKDKNSVLSKYLFYLAFENQNSDDYVTEKLWGSFASGVLPVYMGAPNVLEHVPEKSIINVLDFESKDKLVEHLEKVANDKELYESYHAWRSKPLPKKFHDKYDFTEVHSTCRTCRWAYSRLYGVGWDHYNQSLRELIIPRKVCINKKGLIVQPFVEEWERSATTATKSDGTTIDFQNIIDHDKTCDIGTQNRVLSIDDGKIKRTIYEQDGIIDIVVDSSTETKLGDYIVRFKTSLKKKKKGGEAQLDTINAGHYRLQDDQSRFTFLLQPRSIATATDESATPLMVLQSSSGAGGDGDAAAATVQLTIKPSDIGLPIRLRVITEDIDTLHAGADSTENYFAQQMIEDFYSPVEGFIPV